MSFGALPGFRDFYPAEFAERAYITEGWRRVARRYGFSEYDGPPLEPLELYTRKSGDEIVGQLYNFRDKGDREVALRPEMTPTFARMVGARANALRKPVRWFAIPQLFRYERQQRGRLREHFQLNVDIVGEAGIAADAELVAVAIDVMREFGLTHEDVKVRVSDRRLLAALLDSWGVSAGLHGQVYAVLDKFERQPREVSLERLRAAGFDAASATAFTTAVENSIAEGTLESMGAAFREGTADHLEDLRRYLSHVDALIGAAGAGGARDWVRFDLSIVRGLAYYTGVVFELFDARGELRAICGGGRYDNLLGALGGTDLPALGFGLGDVVLGELLRDRGLMRTTGEGLDFWVAGEDATMLNDVMHVAGVLRSRGRRVEYALRDQALGRQLKSAKAAGADRVVILHREEWGSGMVRVKTLADGSEESVRFSEWSAKREADTRNGE